MKLGFQLVFVIVLLASPIYSQESDCYSVEVSSDKTNWNQTISETYCKGRITSREAKSLVLTKDASKHYTKSELDSFVYNSFGYISQIFSKNMKDEKTESMDTVIIKYNITMPIDSFYDSISKNKIAHILNYLTLQKYERNRMLSVFSDEETKEDWTYELSTKKDTILLNLIVNQIGKYVSDPQIFYCTKANGNSVLIQEVDNRNSILPSFRRICQPTSINFTNTKEIASVIKSIEGEILSYVYNSAGQKIKVQSNLNPYNDIEYSVIHRK